MQTCRWALFTTAMMAGSSSLRPGGLCKSEVQGITVPDSLALFAGSLLAPYLRWPLLYLVFLRCVAVSPHCQEQLGGILCSHVTLRDPLNLTMCLNAASLWATFLVFVVTTHADPARLSCLLLIPPSKSWARGTHRQLSQRIWGSAQPSRKVNEWGPGSEKLNSDPGQTQGLRQK